MKEYKRDYPLFSLCGLNCGLCPRYQSRGTSKCPGCGGSDFHLKHPSCAVIACSKKHGNVAYCFMCKEYPCDKYKNPNEEDSFITYRNVISDMQKAKEYGMEQYRAELEEKIAFLELLIDRYNDGRRMNFYCIAVNLLDLADLNNIKEQMKKELSGKLTQKEQIKMIESMFDEKAKSRNIGFKLRK